ncbi:MAG: helix-turn-helix domain-containing protein [Candidatus Pedobacter colombiensis]|uniref:Helix-turn-helix domain-containing protein n=1 Tax=Candidatus Pedobacter colombiensis TaxID=3121371 RepID=A0AAJ5WBH1_9SPHI|nr:helix-turn-helix domain-containing protein [Pedobacter sp.]WEK21399.1 MAG: helix-turn-helix domain-containing protein [Pedobacter sp.]
MDKINLLIAVALIVMFISLFLSCFLLTVKTEHKLSNRLFAFFLVLTAIDVSGNFFDFLNVGLSNIGMFRNLLIFLQLPAFYLYVLSVCYSDFKLRSRHLIHIIPFLIANLVLLPRFYAVDLASKINFLEKSSSRLEIQFNHILLHVQIVFYIIAAFMILRKSKRIYLENYAGASIASLNWLFQFTVALSFFYFIALVKNIFKFTEYPNISEWLKIGLLLFELLIISWYMFKALNHPDLFRNIDSKLKLVKDLISEEGKSEPAIANESEFNAEFLKLRNYMIEKKPFLNPSLTIKDISNDLEIPVRDLSLLINHKLEQHFYDFVNTYRIESAMDILKDVTKSKVTILEILYEVGFNSKSSFNSAFKKHTGTTPTDYRKAL